MTATLTTGFSEQTFEAFLHARSEPAWLIEQRREAWQSFQAKDWPSRSDEEWIRTDIRLFKLNQFSLPLPLGEGRGEGVPSLLTAGVELAGSTSSINSQPAKAELKPKWAERGV